MKKLLTILFFAPLLLFGQISFSVGSTFPLTDLGANRGKGSIINGIDVKSTRPFISIGYSINDYRFSLSFIRLEGADSLAPANDEDAYYRNIRKNYFKNNIVEVSVIRKFNIALVGASVYYHEFRNHIQPSLLIGASIPLSKNISVEVIDRILATDKIDNYSDEIYSKNLDNFYTVGLIIFFNRQLKQLRCFKF